MLSAYFLKPKKNLSYFNSLIFLYKFHLWLLTNFYLMYFWRKKNVRGFQKVRHSWINRINHFNILKETKVNNNFISLTSMQNREGGKGTNNVFMGKYFSQAIILLKLFKTFKIFTSFILKINYFKKLQREKKPIYRREKRAGKILWKYNQPKIRFIYKDKQYEIISRKLKKNVLTTIYFNVDNTLCIYLEF